MHSVLYKFSLALLDCFSISIPLIISQFPSTDCSGIVKTSHCLLNIDCQAPSLSSAPTSYLSPSVTIKMVNPASTCCKTSQDGGCVCAAQAKCSCGKESALHCTCNKASTENAVSGPRCSCRKFILHDLERKHERLTFRPGARPAGHCTCERSASENQPVEGETCPCGSRPSGEFQLSSRHMKKA